MRLQLRDRRPGNRSWQAIATTAPRFEKLEVRDMLSAQPTVITDASPYSAAYVNAIYRNALGRAAHLPGLSWDVAEISQGQELLVPAAVVHSGEYAGDFVQAAYRQYLGRDAEPAALGYWVTGHARRHARRAARYRLGGQ